MESYPPLAQDPEAPFMDTDDDAPRANPIDALGRGPLHSDPPPRREAAVEASSEARPSTPSRGPASGLDRVLAVPLTVHVELGRKRVRISDLLRLGAGQVLELEVAAGAPLEIYANGTLVAEGEAVVVGDRYGVRITQIVSPEERVARLGGKEIR